MKNSEDNVMKIFIATDTHLGFNEKDPIRGDDSFIAFEEVLRHASENKVDFILLGGDLFHETKPTTSCLHRCMTLLRKYCLGDRPVQIEFLSDQSHNFKHLINPQVNYEDPNLNVSIPVFSIHGNHDDPTGPSRLCPLDLLADVGLVNYFGKWTDLTRVEIYPLLMRKGDTKLALYGLSHIKDERLSRLFASSQVKMLKASGDFFNLFVMHQNRADRGPKNFIPEDVLPPFLDLVIWGHEHDCRIDPEESANGVYISQPGSSVATSLAHGESLTKYAGLLHVRGLEYKLDKIKLRTVRPFVFRDITLHREDEDIKGKVGAAVEEMLQESALQINPGETKQPQLPLIRLVVHHHNESQQFNAIRLGQQYADRVANPQNMVSLQLRRGPVRPGREGRPLGSAAGDEEAGEDVQYSGMFHEHFEAMLESYFEEKEPMSVLSLKGLCAATRRTYINNDDDAYEEVKNHQSRRTQEQLMEAEFNDEQFDHVLDQLRLERTTRQDEETAEIARLLENPGRAARLVPCDDGAGIEVSSDEEIPLVKMSRTGTAAVRRPARGRGSRGARRAARAVPH